MPDERNYYVLCDDNCRFEGMTKEQIIAAIAEATGETPTHIDDAFITKIKEKNANDPLMFWIGTSAQYNAISVKDSDTFYIVTDDDTDEHITLLAEAVEEMSGTVATVAQDVENIKGGSIGDEIICRKKLIWSGTVTDPVTYINLSEAITYGDRIEVEWKDSQLGRGKIRTIFAVQEDYDGTILMSNGTADIQQSSYGVYAPEFVFASLYNKRLRYLGNYRWHYNSSNVWERENQTSTTTITKIYKIIN